VVDPPQQIILNMPHPGSNSIAGLDGLPFGAGAYFFGATIFLRSFRGLFPALYISENNPPHCHFLAFFGRFPLDFCTLSWYCVMNQESVSPDWPARGGSAFGGML
jgi:hypothetical protein